MAITEHDLGPVRGDINDSEATFTQAATRENINSGEAGKTIFGKIKKYFADMTLSAFATIVNNATTTAANTVLDGRMGKILMDKLDELNRNLQRCNKQLWSGDAIYVGSIACDTTGYTVFDVYCTDGVMLRGVRLFDTANNRYYMVLGASGAAYNGSAYIPAIWTGLMDIYNDHFYLQGLTMYTVQDGQAYSNHHISAIYGVW